MVDDARLEAYSELWTTYLQDYVLLQHNGKQVICNRETQIPLMIEDDDLREAVLDKMIDAGVESLIKSDD